MYDRNRFGVMCCDVMRNSVFCSLYSVHGRRLFRCRAKQKVWVTLLESGIGANGCRWIKACCKLDSCRSLQEGGWGGIREKKRKHEVRKYRLERARENGMMTRIRWHPPHRVKWLRQHETATQRHSGQVGVRKRERGGERKKKRDEEKVNKTK